MRLYFSLTLIYLFFLSSQSVHDLWGGGGVGDGGGGWSAAAGWVVGGGVRVVIH